MKKRYKRYGTFHSAYEQHKADVLHWYYEKPYYVLILRKHVKGKKNG